MGKGKKAAVVFAAALALGNSVQAADETVQSQPEVSKVSEEVFENPYGEPFQIKATAYCSCTECCGHDHGITKSGRPAIEGLTVASNLYYGKTIVMYDEDMNFLGFYEVMDTGTDHIDIYMESHEAALEFGVHYYYIQVIDAVG